MSRRRYIVLGATGYLGRAVADALAARSVPVVRARGIADLAGDPPCAGDVVVNCVGRYDAGAAERHAANVTHAGAAARGAAAGGARLLHVSSSAVFDAIRTGTIDEATSPEPASSYGRSKLAGERVVLAEHPGAQLLRPAKIFGGGDPRGRLEALVLHAAAGRPLPRPRRPPLWANFVPVTEAARVVAEEALHPTADVVHLACALPWAAFVALLERTVGRPIPRPPRPVETALRLAVPPLWHLPALALPRQVERVLELWDRRAFVDSAQRIPPRAVSDALDALHRRGLA